MEGFFDMAVQRRESMCLAEAGLTDAVRLLDGDGEGLPGVSLECFASRWLVSTRDREIPPAMEVWLRKQGCSVYHKRLGRQEKLAPHHMCGPAVQAPFSILENGLNYEISFGAGYSQGIFLDQRDNRLALRRRLRPGQSVLNTFAYTGAFSVAAAAAGAVATTLDLSQHYLDWAKRNFSRNGFDPGDHFFCKGDVFAWLRRFARQGRKFDVIILDPPTFSRDERGKVFRVSRDYGSLVSLAATCVSTGGALLACTNYRGMSETAFLKILRSALPQARGLVPAPMPPDFVGANYLKSVWIGL